MIDLGEHVLDRVRQELAIVEEMLAETASMGNHELSAIAATTVRAGGKRARPALLLTTYFANREGDPDETELHQVRKAAVAVELIHAASLVHDDIIDQAESRRGHATCYASHGAHTAIIAGDFLFNQAYSLAAGFSPQIIDIVAETCRELCYGQLLEQNQLGATGNVEDYLSVVQRKTAILIAASSQIGAILGGADDQTAEAFRQFGQNIGIAFQIVDDIIDVVGNPNDSGKGLGVDFELGVRTLPYILAQSEYNLDDNAFKGTDFQSVQQLLTHNGVIDATRAHARDFTRRAQDALGVVRPSEGVENLRNLAEGLCDRLS